MIKTSLETVRLDRWLSSARFYKTRTQAAKACESGKIKVNGTKAKPHKFIHVSDKLIIHNRGRYRNIEVLGLAERGLPAKEARELYHEEVKQLSEEEKELYSLFRASDKKFRLKSKGRPTKKERRQIEKFKNLFKK